MNVTADEARRLLEVLGDQTADPRTHIAAGAEAAAIEAMAEQVEREAISDLERARGWGQVAIRVSDVLGAGRVRARRANAQALAYANQFDAAESQLREAIAIATQSASPLDAAHSRLMLLHTLARQGRLEEAISQGEQSRAEFIQANLPFHAARADINIGVTLRMKDLLAEALARFDLAAPHVQDQPFVLAALLSNRAEALLDLHRYAQALESFTRARECFSGAGAGRAAAIVEGNIADLCGRQGRLDEALEHFEHARRHLGATAAPGDAARLEVERAETLLQVGLIAEARSAFERATQSLAGLGMAFEAARARFGIGRALVAQQRLRESTGVLERAAQEFAAISHATGSRRVQLVQARVLIELGNAAAAAALLGKLPESGALTLQESAERAGIEARIASARGDGPAAASLINHALEQAEQVGLPVLTAELLMIAAQVREQAGDFEGALAALRRAMNSIERIRSGLRAESFRAALSGAFSDAYDRYVRLWLDQEGDPGHALEVIERGRSRALLDVLGGGAWLVEGKSRSDADAALVERRNELCGLIAASHAKLDRPLGATARGKPVSAAELEIQLADVEGRLASTRRYAGEFAPPPSQQQLVAGIPAHAALIEYFVELDQVSAIVVRHGTTTCHRGLCTLTQLADSLGAIRLQLSIAIRGGLIDAGAQSPMADEAMHHLGSMLMAPLWDRVGGASDIAIIADGHVAAVPFQALRIDAGWLVDLTRVLRAPSAAIMNRLCERLVPLASQAPMVVIGLADDNAPRAEDESRDIARTTGAQRVLLGQQATRQAVLHALDGAGDVHIASHARFVAHSPMQSAIRLADGWLTARDLYSVELQGGCVVLSACDTGRTGVGHGRELLGLGRAFLTAGAGSLILSQWLLHDAAAARMVSELYHVRKQSDGPPLSGSDALRLAQRSLRGRLQHPAAWGGWYCVGPWNQTGSVRS